MTEPKRKLPILDQTSAGGVAFRRTGAEIFVAIILVGESERWQLPKGLLEGQTVEEAALREVREEAGIEAEIIEKIDTIEYWYVGDWDGERVRFHKFVHFFLMKYVSGDVADHDHEVAEARWVKIEDAIEMLAFKSEKEVVEKGYELIKIK